MIKIYILILIRPTEFADPVETLQPIPFDDDDTPLSTIPIVYSEQSLLSDWQEEFLKKVYRYVRVSYVSFTLLELMRKFKFKRLCLCNRETDKYRYSFFRRKTPPIDPEILRTMKMQGTIGYAPNPQAFRRNQVRKQYSPTLLQYSPPSLLKLP